MLLTVVEKIQDEWLLLSAGEVTLGLHGTKKNPDKESQENIKFHSNTKIIFEVEQDINALRDQLVSKGVKLKDVITWDNYDYWLCDGEDPEGNVFQLKQKK
ncbi:MAG: VOC family protein [Bacteroidota bacterium]